MRYLTHAGKTMTCSDWAKETGLTPQCISERLATGWSVEDALTKPIRGRMPEEERRRRNRALYQKNRNLISEQGKLYRKAHREELNQQERTRYKNNRIVRLQKQKQYRDANKERVRQYARKWYREHRDRYQAWSKRKFQQNPERHRKWVRKNYLDRAFGLGGAEYYDQQFAKQAGKCAICGKPPGKGRYGRLHQDHKTACCPYQYKNDKRQMLRSCGKCRRGLLCNHCNTALVGLEDPTWMRRAMAYLKHWTGLGASTLTKEQMDLFKAATPQPIVAAMDRLAKDEMECF